MPLNTWWIWPKLLTTLLGPAHPGSPFLVSRDGFDTPTLRTTSVIPPSMRWKEKTTRKYEGKSMERKPASILSLWSAFRGQSQFSSCWGWVMMGCVCVCVLLFPILPTSFCKACYCISLKVVFLHGYCCDSHLTVRLGPVPASLGDSKSWIFGCCMRLISAAESKPGGCRIRLFIVYTNSLLSVTSALKRVLLRTKYKKHALRSSARSYFSFTACLLCRYK